MERIEIKSIYMDPKKFENKSIKVAGWVRSARGGKSFGFIDLNDGSSFKGIQIVFDADKLIGNGFVLPLGPLREPLFNVSRADKIILVGENVPYSMLVVCEFVLLLFSMLLSLFSVALQNVFNFVMVSITAGSV